EALAELKAGNARFVRGESQLRDLPQARQALAAGQHPAAIILCCSDSRVPPELVFDQTLGRLFVVRAAGNVVDPALLGSIEYAVEHLGARLLVVLGHSSCGAVDAALKGGSASPNLRALVERIAPAAARAKRLDRDAAGT